MWIPIHEELKENPKTKKLSRLLGISKQETLGYLIYLWLWSTKYAKDGNLDKYESIDIEDGCDWQGEEGKFFNALIQARFIVKGENGFEINDWNEYAGKYLKEAEKQKERMRERRSSFNKEGKIEEENSLLSECYDNVNITLEECNPNVSGKNKNKNNIRNIIDSNYSKDSESKVHTFELEGSISSDFSEKEKLEDIEEEHEEEKNSSFLEGESELPPTPGFAPPHPPKSPEKKGGNGKAKEVELTKEFELVWEEFPRKKGKENSFKGYCKWRKSYSYEQILTAVKNYANDNKNTEQKYIKYGSSFFNSIDNLLDNLTTSNSQKIILLKGKQEVFKQAAGLDPESILNNFHREFDSIKQSKEQENKIPVLVGGCEVYEA